MTHLAETRGEREFLMGGRGKFLEFLRTVGLLDDSSAPFATKPLQLRDLGLLPARRKIEPRAAGPRQLHRR